MFDSIKRKIKLIFDDKKEKSATPKIHICNSISENMSLLKKQFPNSMDLNSREIEVGKTKLLLLRCEGLVDSENMTISLVKPLITAANKNNYNSEELCDFILNKSILAAEQKEIHYFDELFNFIMAGFVVVIVEGEARGFAMGMQGFKFRSISQPENETNELGAKDGFTEPLRINITLIRRRIRSPKLRFEQLTIGNKSKTDICLIYLSDVVSQKLINDIKRKIEKVNLDIVLDSSYLRPYLEKSPFSLFSSIGSTERPDVLCGKINEGRVGILVDGSPFALILPFLFNENFKSFDDYAHRPYFSSFIRILKYLSFYVSFLLPGAYVGISTFHPELLPHALLFSIAASEEVIPFSLMVEAIFIYLVFEIMREAGIRLPSAVGHTIGIVGALVIGDAAVNAGLIGAPMVMVVAITAICAFSIPQLYEPIMILRFLFIIIGGISGLFGIALGAVLVGAIICSMNSMSVPMSAPISPFDLRWLADSFIFAGIRKNSSASLKIQNIKGSKLESGEEE